MKVVMANKRAPKVTREEFIKQAEERQRKRMGMPQTSQELTNTEVVTLISALVVLAYYDYTEEKVDPSDKQTVVEMCAAALPVVIKARLSETAYVEVMNEFTATGVVKKTARNFEAFLKGTLAFQKTLATNYKTAPVLLSLLDYARKMAAGSENAFNYIEQKIGILKNEFLTSLFVSNDLLTQDEYLPTLKSLVKKLQGTGYDLNVEQRKKARAKNEELYNQFLAVRREAMAITKTWARNYVRANGSEGLVSYDKFMKALEKAGMVVHSYPTGFKGYIDDMGRLYTLAKKRIEGAPGGGQALMNPGYNPKEDNAYVFKAKIPGALTQPMYYTVEYKSKSRVSKFEAVDELIDKIDSIRKKWLAKLRSGGLDEEDPDFLAAMVLEIIYQTQARIGDVNNATMDKRTGKYKQTYGLTTIEMRHVRVVSNGINISYAGKAAFKGDVVHKQKHSLIASEHPAIKKIVGLISEWKEERDADDYVFSVGGRAISPAHVNKFFRQCGAPTGVTVHKLRTLKGTLMMNEIVAKHPWKRKQADSTNEVMKWLKDKATKIGKQLGHMSGETVTPTTAIANYCNPTAMGGLFKDAKVMPHPVILKLMKADGDLQGMEDAE